MDEACYRAQPQWMLGKIRATSNEALISQRFSGGRIAEPAVFHSLPQDSRHKAIQIEEHPARKSAVLKAIGPEDHCS